MKAAIYWFRNDLRVNDNPAFTQACEKYDKVFAVYVNDPKQNEQTHWGFERIGVHRKAFLAGRLNDLALQLKMLGYELTELQGSPKDVLSAFAKAHNTAQICCEDIAAPEEQAEISDLNAAGLAVKTLWQSSLLEPADLPFDVENLPAVFTAFRNKIEKQALKPRETVQKIPQQMTRLPESEAEKHLKNYFSGDFALTYKLTRNQPMNWSADEHFSTKFSPWLACGAISAPMIYAELKRFEAERGANESTYWIWFELLWRDYFRFLHLQHGEKLYRKQGLGGSELAKVQHNKHFFAVQSLKNPEDKDLSKKVQDLRNQESKIKEGLGRG